jgi:hypothetical protein
MVVHACNPSTLEAKAGGSEMEVSLYSKFKASLGHTEDSLSRNKTKIHELFLNFNSLLNSGPLFRRKYQNSIHVHGILLKITDLRPSLNSGFVICSLEQTKTPLPPTWG